VRIVAIAMVVVVITMVFVVIAMVFAIPMTFMHLPATLIMVVVRMTPVGSRVRRSLPDAGDPDISSAALSPVAIDPGVAISWDGRPCLIANGGRRRADVNLYLAECRNC
jgi:hypothetical protein